MGLWSKLKSKVTKTKSFEESLVTNIQRGVASVLYGSHKSLVGEIIGAGGAPLERRLLSDTVTKERHNGPIEMLTALESVVFVRLSEARMFSPKIVAESFAIPIAYRTWEIMMSKAAGGRYIPQKTLDAWVSLSNLRRDEYITMFNLKGISDSVKKERLARLAAERTCGEDLTTPEVIETFIREFDKAAGLCIETLSPLMKAYLLSVENR